MFIKISLCCFDADCLGYWKASWTLERPAAFTSKRSLSGQMAKE